MKFVICNLFIHFISYQIMTGDTKLFIGIGIATLVLVIGAVLFLSGNQTTQTPTGQPVDSQLLLRDDLYNTMGSKNPIVTIVEFSDFNCPACKAAAPILKSITNEYPDQVKFIYRYLPLPQYPDSQLADESAESAGSQGYFWDMHDLLFANQHDFTQEKLIQLASQIENLNLDQFTKDLQQHTFKNKVDLDNSQAHQLNLNSTPSIFINGILFAEQVSFDNLKTNIEAYLKSAPPNPVIDSTSVQSATPSADINGT